jgi:hypothetical protein
MIYHTQAGHLSIDIMMNFCMARACSGLNRRPKHQQAEIKAFFYLSHEIPDSTCGKDFPG